MEIHLNCKELKQNAAIKDQQDYLEKNILLALKSSFRSSSNINEIMFPSMSTFPTARQLSNFVIGINLHREHSNK